ncbi:MAG: hypothetical protein FJ265_16885 [Planctomycetes bacterium]|nr:hypothetical protein [Planctomycetota bacterium]
MKWFVPFVVAFGLVLGACSQEPPKLEPKQQEPKQQEPKQQDPQALLKEMLAQFQKEGIEFDQKAQTVTMPAFVNRPEDLLEYLLIHRRGKRHEAMFYTKCKPSLLNGALLLLGLQPGRNAKAEEIVPAPSIEEIEKGAETVKVTPPQGMPFWMTVHWQTPEGQRAEFCVEDLLLDLSTQKPVVDCSWIYLGGRMAAIYRNEPEVFVADFEGNLISTCYMYPENHLATISHQLGRDQQNWWFTNKVPEPETEVRITFHRQESKLHKERAERLKKEAAAEAAGEKKEAAKEGEKEAEPEPQKERGGG